MKNLLSIIISAGILSLAGCDSIKYRKISVSDYRDKMKAGWIGQIAGVCWGGPTEFRWQTEIIPADMMPKWTPEMINDAFGQDDLYTEMTFLHSMEQYGLDVSIRQAGIDFANSGYPLWHANNEGRMNLRSGIAPPDCSHPKNNIHADDIDYQIEADFSGLIAPSMPNIVIAMGNKFGRLMNYGDGVYAGIFVGAMYAEAFFEKDIVKIIKTALKAIPADSQYAEMVRDMLQWYSAEPDNWEDTWRQIEAKYHDNKNYRRITCDDGNYNIDAKINGAYILMGLLYGKGDLDKTIIISTRCGQDSDCNPSNAAGVLFTTLGFSKLPARFSEKLDETRKFSHTEYNFPMLLDVCENLARQAIIKEGGKIEKDSKGNEYFLIPDNKPVLMPTMKSWEPLPEEGSYFSEDEMAQITHRGFRNIQQAVNELFNGWTISNIGSDMDPGYREEYRGKNNVIMTHPKNQETPCTFTRDIYVPESKKTVLKTMVSHHDSGDWDLVIRINGSVKKTITVSKETVGKDGWLEVNYNLSNYAGNNITLMLENKATDWAYEAGYWAELNIDCSDY